MTAPVALVVPVYNEERRLDVAQLAKLAAAPNVSVLVVDDGSTDRTVELVQPLVTAGTVRLLSLVHNGGKSEAVRRGLLHEIDLGATIVGYADADFATPVDELLRVAELTRQMPQFDAVLSSRVRLAGRRVERRIVRHYLGRLIATFIDVRVRLDVYDTQCGAKFFRATPDLAAALGRPFRTRWLFDVELLARLRQQAAAAGRRIRLLEEPLHVWADVGGSRIRGKEMLRVLKDFAELERELQTLRRAK